MPATLSATATSATEIQRIFNRQQDNHLHVGKSRAKERIAKLDKLYDLVMRYRPQMKEAMHADFKKPPFEVDAVEVFPITGAIKHARGNLRRWMHPKKVPAPLAFAGSSSWIRYEPKGLCLLISPWNFPFNLSFVPLVSAIAAGNCVVLKPSEMTPHSSALIKKMVGEIFDENEVAVVEGAVGTAQALLELPFHHIFFTGAPSIGKIVMKAAAENLASVTLELGGKSPTVIDETADLKTAASRTVRGKFANCGQICVAPDYVLVHEKVKDEFLKLVKEKILESYGNDPLRSDSFACMVNDRHFQRVKGYLDDAVSKGAKIFTGGKLDATARFIAPTVVTDVPEGSQLLQEEIFGPVLPVRAYRDLQEAIDFINARERPLTMSIFSQSKKNTERLLSETRAGGTCINHSQLHFYNHDLPFGGINNSGIGKSHGWFGFEGFSNARAIYRQDFWGPAELLKAPYSKFTEWAMGLTIKWF